MQVKLEHFVIRFQGRVMGFSPTHEEAQRLCAFFDSQDLESTFERRPGPMPSDPDDEVLRLRAADAAGRQVPVRDPFSDTPVTGIFTIRGESRYRGCA